MLQRINTLRLGENGLIRPILLPWRITFGMAYVDMRAVSADW